MFLFTMVMATYVAPLNIDLIITCWINPTCGTGFLPYLITSLGYSTKYMSKRVRNDTPKFRLCSDSLHCKGFSCTCLSICKYGSLKERWENQSQWKKFHMEGFLEWGKHLVWTVFILTNWVGPDRNPKWIWLLKSDHQICIAERRARATVGIRLTWCVAVIPTQWQFTSRSIH